MTLWSKYKSSPCVLYKYTLRLLRVNYKRLVWQYEPTFDATRVWIQMLCSSNGGSMAHLFFLRFDLMTIVWLWSLDWSRCLSLEKIKRFRINLCNKPWVFCLQVGWNLKFMRCLYTCQCYINLMTKAWLLDYHVKRGMILLSTCSMAILGCSPCYLGMPSLPMACLIDRKLCWGFHKALPIAQQCFLNIFDSIWCVEEWMLWITKLGWVTHI